MFWFDSLILFLAKTIKIVHQYLSISLEYYIYSWLDKRNMISSYMFLFQIILDQILSAEKISILYWTCVLRPVQCKPNVLRLEAAKLSWNFPIKYRSWNFITALTRSHYTVLFNFNNQFFKNSFKMCIKLHYTVYFQC